MPQTRRTNAITNAKARPIRENAMRTLKTENCRNAITHAECTAFMEMVVAWDGKPVMAQEMSEFLFEDGADDDLQRLRCRNRVHAIGARLIRESELVWLVDGWTLPEWIDRSQHVRLPRKGARAMVTVHEVAAVVDSLSGGYATAAEVAQALYSPSPSDEPRACARTVTVLNAMMKDGLVVREPRRNPYWSLTRSALVAA